MVKKLICQGAEAKIFFDGENILKYRISKKYRHPIIDNKIRFSRTRREARILFKAHKFGINVPNVLNFNEKKSISLEKDKILLEYIDGEKLSDFLEFYSRSKQDKIMELFGKQVELLHENNIVHSDLTTSNVIFSKKEIYIIDFGLSYISRKIEDKAVDIHLLKQALNAKHYNNFDKLYKSFRKGYNPYEKNRIFDQLEKVESRGRYKH